MYESLREIIQEKLTPYKIVCLLIFISMCVHGCKESGKEPLNQGVMEEIKGRDENGQRLIIYRARTPPDWIRRDSLPDESLQDTTKALCEFLIREENQQIRIAIHNFPTDRIEERIPPHAQVTRWQKQFNSIDSSSSNTCQVAFNGFVGVLFKGVGNLEEQDSMMLGWSLQIAADHYRMLSHPSPQLASRYHQMRADVTIKATGPCSLMEKYLPMISAFAQSFELIDEIPQR